MGDRYLAPIQPDLDALASKVNEQCIDAGVAQFLRASAVTALDPASPFWSDIVHYLCVGYLLFRHVGRVDATTAAHGSWADETVFLDTPILLQLLAAPNESAPTWELISELTRLGVRVVVLSCTLSGLRANVVNSADHQKRIASDIEAGVSPAYLIRSLRGAARAWVTHAISSGVLPSWKDFERRVETFEKSFTGLDTWSGGSFEFWRSSSRIGFAFPACADLSNDLFGVAVETTVLSGAGVEMRVAMSILVRVPLRENAPLSWPHLGCRARAPRVHRGQIKRAFSASRLETPT